MRLRESTIAGLCFFLAGVALFVPLPAYGAEYEGIDNDRVSWSCGVPITNLSPPPVDLDEVRADLAAQDLASGTAGAGTNAGTAAAIDENGTTDNTDNRVSSRHPQCAGLARTQLVLGLLSLAAGIWRGRRWWKENEDARAERKFKRLHESAGKPSARLF